MKKQITKRQRREKAIKQLEKQCVKIMKMALKKERKKSGANETSRTFNLLLYKTGRAR